jgi:hypothetical protein
MLTIQKFNDLKIIHPDGYETNKKKYFITNVSEISINNYETISSIDIIPQQYIKDCHFFLFFHSDDEYLYHLDKIIINKGTFSVHPNANKTNYVHSNKYTRFALMDTLNKNDEISHYNEIIHGNICQAIEQTRKIEGDYVEIGVYKGGSALTALNYMRYANINRKSYFVDTYDGFNYNEANESSDIHWNGSHKLWGCEETIKRVDKLLREENSNQNFELIKSNICSEQLPLKIEKIAVANIDVDIYDATKAAIEKIAERLVTGGIIIAEDPASTPQLIGAYYAMEKFLQTPLGQKFMKIHVTGQYFLIKNK